MRLSHFGPPAAVVAAAWWVMSPLAIAVPEIHSGTPLFEHGAGYIIAGSAFGMKSSPEPIRFDDFENGTLGNGLSAWDLVSSHGTIPVYSNTYTRPNSDRSAKCSFEGEQYNCTFRTWASADVREVYLDFWYLYDPASPASRNHKLFRLYPNGGGMPNSAVVIWCDPERDAAVGNDGPSDGQHFVYFPWNWGVTVREWVHVQVHMKASSVVAADGSVRLWFDCVKQVDDATFRTRDETYPSLWRQFQFGNFLGHGEDDYCAASPGPSFTFWDDVYVDSTQARVEVGNAPTYDSCTHREIQIPTAWSPESITITVNQGSFETGETAWLFVIDADGSVSNGYEIQVGALMQGDATPPSAVTTLAVSTTTQTSATLTWTAVGDDGSTGTATSYDIRYSTTNITTANWASVTQVIGEPNPEPAGSQETFTVTGLTAGTTYYFALKVADEVPNWSGLSNVASGATLASDVTPPAPVDDLGAVTATDKWVQLAWTAVGDDGHTGTAKTYDLRFSTAPIDAGTWGAATRVSGEPAPSPAGQPESFTVDGLDPGTTYYFALKVADEASNWSALSNLASASTTPAENPSGIACGSWSDGNFIGADWNAIPLISGTSSIDLLATQEAGGNPGAFRQIDLSLGATPEDSAFAIHLYQPIVWDLDALGPIESLDAGLDFRSLNGAPTCLGLVVHQVATGESYAWVPTETAADPNWTSYRAAGLTPEDFLPVRAGRVGHPGLGVGMGLILFGFLIGQRAVQAGGASLIQAGVDNWWIDVNPDSDPGGGHQADRLQITQMSLRGNYPNPFKPETRIVFELPSTQPVLLRVFDPTGRLVRTLVNETLPAGMHASVWQAKDDDGRPIPSGVYLYRLQAGERVATRMACVVE